MEFVFCREYGLQPVLYNVNFGRSQARDNPPVIINQFAPKPTPVWTGGIQYKPENEVVPAERVLYIKLITLNNFKGYEKIYVGKTTNFYFRNIPFDFTNDKWQIKDLPNSSLNNFKFNVYDRAQIRSILNSFLTRKQEEVFNLLYATIPNGGLDKFLAILEVVIEYKDDFLKLLEPPADVPYVDPYANKKPITTTTGNGNSGNGNEKKDNTIYYIAGGIAALWLWKRRNKKSRKS